MPKGKRKMLGTDKVNTARFKACKDWLDSLLVTNPMNEYLYLHISQGCIRGFSLENNSLIAYLSEDFKLQYCMYDYLYESFTLEEFKEYFNQMVQIKKIIK
jgi:hypothetical protein